MLKKDSKILGGYFFILFALIPISIILGPAISLFNILLINVSFICLIIYTEEYKFLSNKTVKLALILYLYLIFNSIISENFSIGAFRNFGFIRFIILFCAFNYFFYYKSFFNKIFIIWALILFILTTDTYIEVLTGTNIFGHGEAHGRRAVSFFIDEPIVGGYINAFYLIVVGYFFSIKHKFSVIFIYLVLLISLFFLWAIFLTGERSNAIRAIFGFLIFYSINSHFKTKEKLITFILTFIMISSLIYGSSYLKSRYVNQFLNPISNLYDYGIKIFSEPEVKSVITYRKKPVDLNMYFSLYQSGFSVFKSYPFFGGGNKNYRIEACKEDRKYDYVCNTHPHQIYIEFLAEHGLIGTIILLFILFNLIFSKLKIILQSKNYIQIGSFIFLFNLFIPLLPSGAFFTDSVLTIFWLNLSLMYSVNKKTNIFFKV